MTWSDFSLRFPFIFKLKKANVKILVNISAAKTANISLKNSTVYIKGKDPIITLKKRQKSFCTWYCCNKCQIIYAISIESLP
jgi:hypothetical protein